MRPGAGPPVVRRRQRAAADASTTTSGSSRRCRPSPGRTCRSTCGSASRPAPRCAAPPTDRVALFVHGAGTPAEVAFDVAAARLQLDGLSRRRRLRHLRDGHHRLRPIEPAGGDERSLQPRARIARAPFVPSLIPAPCAAELSARADHDCVGLERHRRVVNYIRALRHVDKVSLLAWSLGGPRAGGYAAQHPEKVQKLVLLAPAYGRNASAAPPAKMPPDGVPMNTQSREEFYANWDRQVGCPGAVRSRGRRRGLVGDARLRSGRRDLGLRRAPRAADRDLGLERRRGRQDADADADDRRAARQAGVARPRPRALRRPRRAAESCSSISPARPTTRCGRRTTC